MGWVRVELVLLLRKNRAFLSIVNNIEFIFIFYLFGVFFIETV